MAGSDLHVAMGILSSEALTEQGPLFEELRIAIRTLIALEESPASMMNLVADNRLLASASARLRHILEALLARQLGSKSWYWYGSLGVSDSLLKLLLQQFKAIASSAVTAGVTSGDTVTTQSTTVDKLAKPPRDEAADEASTMAPAIAFKQDQPVSTDQDLGFVNSPVSTTKQKQRWGNPTHVDTSSLVKLEVVKKMVRILLAERIDDDGLLFLPLAGGPASGKTLLAHTLFNDARIVEKFVVRVWVHVSQRFDVSKMLREISSVALTGGYIFENQAFLHQKREALSNQRYLIVFDDAWSENVQEWRTLMEALPSNGTVILTSRIPAVVSCFATAKPHLKTINAKLQFKFVHLWEVIRREIQAALTKKLSFRRRQQQQQNLRRREYFSQITGRREAGELTEFVLQKAHASYFNLPPNLRKCLLYCSVFPLGHEFHPEEIADIFVAEGGISPAMTQAQRIGFVQKLFDECFYPVEEHESTTGKHTYWMYAVMHEFAKIVEVLPDEIAQYFHRVKAHENTTLERTYWMHGIVHMLANIVQRRRSIPIEMKMDEYFFNTILRHMRVLNCLQGTDISTSLHKFGMMTNLRYLNLSRTDIERIPSFVMKLQFLQTLILSHCQKLQILDDTTSMLVELQKLDLEGCCYLMALPPGISKMKSLRFLNVHGCSSLTGMPYGMGQLTNLETMLGHIVSNNGGAISELQPLANLKMLTLEGLENISNVADARDVRLGEKHYLESLAFQWNMSADNSKSSSVAQILECLKPNQNLKALEIVGYEDNDHPSWMASANPYLISLVVIRLVNLKKCETLPPLGLLPLLKIVEISGAETISSISNSFYGSSGTFPSLEKLTFSYMSNLELWEQPHWGPVFPCLAEVTIIQCPKLALHVEFPSVTKLILWMNNKMIYSSEGALGTVTQNLKHVSISFCQELISSSLCEGLQDLCRLKGLELCGCNEMTNLPRGLQHLSSLRSLTIMHCIKLETLPDWLGSLSSLSLLRLYSCPMLYSIPEVLRQRTCTHISIKDCPKLSAQPSGTFLNNNILECFFWQCF